jgi:hypothetical protein
MLTQAQQLPAEQDTLTDEAQEQSTVPQADREQPAALPAHPLSDQSHLS